MNVKRFICVLIAAMLCLCMTAQATDAENKGEVDPSMVFVAPGTDAPETEYPDLVGDVICEELEPEPTLEPEAEPQASPTPETTATPEEGTALRLEGVSIGIDPGHQLHANSELEPNSPDSDQMKEKVLSGTQGVSTGIPEYETNLTISLQLRDALQALGATVYMTRETNDVDISNMERALFFNEKNVDLALRIHCNGSSNSSASGVGTYARSKGEKQAESEQAAYFLLDAICEATGAKRDGVFLRDNYTGQNWATVPCVMIEMGFMSNPEEDVKLNDPEYQRLMVAGIAEGVCRYIESVNGTAGYQTLQEGNRGSGVEALQERLIELGMLSGRVDGIYGPKTAAAVRAFQEANGLEGSGIADPTMQELLFAAPTDAEAGDTDATADGAGDEVQPGHAEGDVPLPSDSTDEYSDEFPEDLYAEEYGLEPGEALE